MNNIWFVNLQDITTAKNTQKFLLIAADKIKRSVPLKPILNAAAQHFSLVKIELREGTILF